MYIVARCLINVVYWGGGGGGAGISRHVPKSDHDNVAFLNDFAYDAETTKNGR